MEYEYSHSTDEIPKHAPDGVKKWSKNQAKWVMALHDVLPFEVLHLQYNQVKHYLNASNPRPSHLPDIVVHQHGEVPVPVNQGKIGRHTT